MSKILVTGTSGFIGGRFLKKLVEVEGASNVVAFSSVAPSEGHFMHHNNYQLSPGFFAIHGWNALETVVHIGAFIPKSGADANQVEGCQTNVVNTYNLIHALPPSVKRVVFLSTTDVYRETEAPISESSLVDPGSLYGSSKWYGEKMMQAWGRLTGRDVVILRIGHTYGPGEEAYRKVIPVTIKRLQQGLAPQVWGTGNALRSFIFIDDVVDCLLQATRESVAASPVNIVSSNAISMLDLVNRLIQISGLQLEPEFMDTTMPERHIRFNNQLMQAVFGLERMSLNDGLQAEWNHMKQLAH